MQKFEQYRHQGQDFNEIRDWCLQRGLFFEDPFFRLDIPCEWKRPPELVEFPKLFVEGTSGSDVVQGALDNNWMVAAIASLSMHPDMVTNVVPLDQSFTNKYAGIFHFRFWQFGVWFDVVIDDRLPTVNGKLICSMSATPNEFWSALFEKAYCKVLGNSYNVAPTAGNVSEVSEALEDFTGGVVEHISLQRPPNNFQQIFVSSVEKQSLIVCSVANTPGPSVQTVTDLGLVKGHNYSVLGVHTVSVPGRGTILLVRLRNPWGRFEWRGPWSDGSQEWLAVPESIKAKLGVVVRDDGEFWMAFTDFIKQFHWVEMCHLSPDAFSGLRRSIPRNNTTGGKSGPSIWELYMFRNSWVKGVTAGGSRYLHVNPQIRFTLRAADAGNVDGVCSVLIALTQNTIRKVQQYNLIGYEVYLLNDRRYDSIRLDGAFFAANKPVAKTPVTWTREVAQRFDLKPGAYCVVPFTQEAEKEGDFLVRIFSEKKATANQVGHSVSIETTNLRGSVVAPMNVLIAEELYKSDDIFKEQLRKISKGTMEVGRQGLKDMLVFAVNNEISPSVDFGRSPIVTVAMNTVTHVFQKVLDAFKGTTNAFQTISPEGFSKNLIRNMFTLFDVNRSGKIDFRKFKLVWNEVYKWKSVYETYSDRTGGYLNSSDLRNALQLAGFTLNNKILTDMIHQYASEDGKIPFNDFLCCGFKIKIISETFKAKDTQNWNRAEFTFEEFLNKTVYM